MLEFILGEIRSRGPMSFARFMELALYHPEFGYYQKSVKLGKSGDFYTSSHVSPVFGRLIGKQLKEMWDILGRPGVFHAVELGAGEGFLARDVLDFAASDAEFSRAVDYRVVEISQRLRQLQGQRLRASVSWTDSLDLFPEDSLVGCVFSNELVDSFPVHRVTLREGKLLALRVGEEKGRLVEVVGGAAEHDCVRYFDGLGLALPEGIRTEVNLRIRPWMSSVARALRRGYVMTVDYGLPAFELYSPARRDGTLRAYREHRVSENPLASPGEQDLTCHVDFTTVGLAGEEAGVTTLGFTDQTHFLMGIGEAEIRDALAASGGHDLDSVRRRSSILNLIHPEMMGGTYRVLLQGKGVEWPPLSGLQNVRVRWR
ncbi:MAG: SAM-dependent methyltransferase [Planctomycetes bacterium]|nr:SAM-dependent methyltransferase [Planctomycetota bacterium]